MEEKGPFLVIGCLNIVGLPYFYLALADSVTTTSIYLNTMGLVFLGNAAYAPVLIFLNERFPTSIRSTGTGLSWNMGFAIGGMMPTFVTLASGSIEKYPVHTYVFCDCNFSCLHYWKPHRSRNKRQSQIETRGEIVITKLEIIRNYINGDWQEAKTGENDDIRKSCYR
ncbi:hypothetical protein RCO48_30980 [Peribacillus frigoritolerans]|nr:hypothetical protein [Peribacillus frigoritolerans]